ncbi:MAG: type II toxin-antitoxin system VapC family toxin [Blastocatellia bacterium]
MATYYADTSVLVKRHLTETGSAWIRALSRPLAGNLIITAQMSLVELYSALNRRVRENSINPLRYARIIAVSNRIWSSQYDLIGLTATLVSETRDLFERHPLRAYDAVQLASALHARRLLLAAGATTPIFLSADDRLLVVAQAEGFATDNPNLHT